jgi:putative endonuclease
LRSDNRSRGRKGEEAAAKYIASQNCEVLEKNYFTKYGEIDIIFKDEDTLVFAEVKYRSDESYGKPAEAVTVAKIRKITKTALSYLYQKGMTDAKCRFDVIEVTGRGMQIRQIKNAFEAQE